MKNLLSILLAASLVLMPSNISWAQCSSCFSSNRPVLSRILRPVRTVRTWSYNNRVARASSYGSHGSSYSYGSAGGYSYGSNGGYSYGSAGGSSYGSYRQYTPVVPQSPPVYAPSVQPTQSDDCYIDPNTGRRVCPQAASHNPKCNCDPCTCGPDCQCGQEVVGKFAPGVYNMVGKQAPLDSTIALYAPGINQPLLASL